MAAIKLEVHVYLDPENESEVVSPDLARKNGEDDGSEFRQKDTSALLSLDSSSGLYDITSDKEFLHHLTLGDDSAEITGDGKLTVETQTIPLPLHDQQDGEYEFIEINSSADGYEDDDDDGTHPPEEEKKYLHPDEELINNTAPEAEDENEDVHSEDGSSFFYHSVEDEYDDANSDDESSVGFHGPENEAKAIHPESEDEGGHPENEVKATHPDKQMVMLTKKEEEEYDDANSEDESSIGLHGSENEAEDVHPEDEAKSTHPDKEMAMLTKAEEEDEYDGGPNSPPSITAVADGLLLRTIRCLYVEADADTLLFDYGTRCPCDRRVKFYTTVDNQRTFKFKIEQCEDGQISEIHRPFQIRNLDQGPAGSIWVLLNFSIDIDGNFKLEIEGCGRVELFPDY